jgi:hypothetical protein
VICFEAQIVENITASAALRPQAFIVSEMTWTVLYVTDV